jgi:hypothetical protein
MKKIFVALFVLLALGTIPVLANSPTTAYDKAVETLKKEFLGVEGVEWTSLGDYQRALFVFNHIRVEAYFDTDGEMIGFDRYISMNQLPLEVLRAFTKRFNESTIIDILEIKNASGTSYRLNVETLSKSYYVKISSAGIILRVTPLKNYPA